MLDGLLTKQNISVDTVNDMVRLRIGNAEMNMPYETAIQLGGWLWHHGKQAKRNAGDRSKHFHVLGTLTDAEHRDQ